MADVVFSIRGVPGRSDCSDTFAGVLQDALHEQATGVQYTGRRGAQIGTEPERLQCQPVAQLGQ